MHISTIISTFLLACAAQATAHRNLPGADVNGAATVRGGAGFNIGNLPDLGYPFGKGGPRRPNLGRRPPVKPPVKPPAPAPPISGGLIESFPNRDSTSFVDDDSPVARAVLAYKTVALQHHNMHRKNHSAPDMFWNVDLANYAQTVADSCKFEHDLTPGGGNYGQNLAAYGSSNSAIGAQSPNIYLARAITNQWYNSEFNAFLPSYYGQASPPTGNFAAWGHFSQVVWKGSNLTGCATKFCGPNTIFPGNFYSWFTVCNYRAPGNFQNKYSANIGKPLGNATVTAP